MWEYPEFEERPFKARDGEIVEVVASFVCPFCGLAAEALKEYGVVHALPPCKQFTAMEPHEYLHAVNVAHGNHGPVN